jgi:hypothetical protein
VLVGAGGSVGSGVAVSVAIAVGVSVGEGVEVPVGRAVGVLVGSGVSVGMGDVANSTGIESHRSSPLAEIHIPNVFAPDVVTALNDPITSMSQTSVPLDGLA